MSDIAHSTPVAPCASSPYASPPFSPPAAGGSEAASGSLSGLADINLDASSDSPALEIPPLRVVVLLCGTVGDVMPFIQMAKLMQERHGHVTRIVTHSDLREPVEKAGLRFFPLGGNAKRMAGWGPAFSLDPVIFTKLALNPATTLKLLACRDMIHGCLKACTLPDPNDSASEPWHADVIMANPMCLGHIHCAEALGIPLHMFFPNPWVATRDYPHSFSGWNYPNRPTPGVGAGYEWIRYRAHFWSYRLVDGVLWHSFLPFVNDMRAQAHLRTLRLGNFVGGTILSEAKVPFTQMWSPSLCPRPTDWPEQANVVGFFFWDQKASEVDESSKELAPLVAWLESGEKPVYIGFGSMVFDGLKCAATRAPSLCSWTADAACCLLLAACSTPPRSPLLLLFLLLRIPPTRKDGSNDRRGSTRHWRARAHADRYHRRHTRADQPG